MNKPKRDPWDIYEFDVPESSSAKSSNIGDFTSAISDVGDLLNDVYQNRIRRMELKQKRREHSENLRYEKKRDRNLLFENSRQFDIQAGIQSRSQNQTALDMLLGQREKAGANARRRTFSDAVSSAMRGG